MLDKLISAARKIGASDLHLNAGYYPMVRVDGRLVPLKEIEEKSLQIFSVAEERDIYGNAMDAKLLQQYIEEGLSQEQKLILQKNGEADFAWDDEIKGRCRVNAYRSGGSYGLAVRLIGREIPTCRQLGIPPAVQNLIKARHGLILVTGATGSGKSTTLAALLQKLNEEESLHILTLEDPIEYKYASGRSMVNQREVGRDTQSFASGLRSALREDPDVILVGELRDAESLQAALQAAETGHLVLSTLHTRDAVTTVQRIIDMLPERATQVKSQLAAGLLGLVSQELHRRKNGSGRVAAMEILINNNAVGNLIREGRFHQIYSYLQTGSGAGMQSMSMSLKKLRQEGII